MKEALSITACSPFRQEPSLISKKQTFLLSLFVLTQPSALTISPDGSLVRSDLILSFILYLLIFPNWEILDIFFHYPIRVKYNLLKEERLLDNLIPCSR